MSEQINEITWLKVEDHLRTTLSGDLQKNALDYIAYMKVSGIILDSKPPYSYDSPDGKVYNYNFGSDIRAKAGLFIVLVIEPGERGWTICMGSSDNNLSGSEYQNRAKFPADEKVKEFAWEHARICQNFRTNGEECGCGRQPGKRITLFGKEIDNSCDGNIEINNPHGETLELTKRLTDLWK